MDAAERRRELRQAVREQVPACPGVYSWLGPDGECLYIGKSRNLRARMLSYLTPANARPDARQRHLVSAIRRFEWHTTAGELMALLLEDTLIKERNPRHNERQKDYRERRYLLLTDDPFPTCLVVEAPSHRRGTLYGPFKDEHFAADLRTLLTDTFGLRACSDREPFRHSARFDLGQCLAPCRGMSDASPYAAIVRRITAFLAGDASWVEAKLSAEMAEASEHLQFERAAATRDSLAFCQRFTARQAFFRAFESETMTVGERASALSYEFAAGTLSAAHTDRGEPLAIPPQLEQPITDRRLLLDRANIVFAWLKAQKSPGPVRPIRTGTAVAGEGASART